MSQLMDYTEYLVKEIGPRPAGTEEEHQAALYITEQFQKEAGFTANMEEFTSSSNYVNGRAILAIAMVVVVILAIIFPVLAIPAFILGCAAAAVYTLEALGRPLISRYLSRDVSQNVVAKYQPNFEDAAGGRGTRSRKIVLVAHYDTDRVTPAIVDRVQSTGLPLPLICLVAMIVSAFFLLIRIFVAPGGGVGLLVLNVLAVIALVICLLPVVKAALLARAPYNEGANNNATGTAALIEVARRISRGSVSEADLANNADQDVFIHGEDAARAEGLIPEGVQIRYEAEQLTPPSEIGNYDEEERLLAAKAAIAALTGKPVERKVYGSVADKLVNTRAEASDAEASEWHGQTSWTAGGYGAEAPVQAANDNQSDWGAQDAGTQGTADGFDNAPSWFVAAQQNAKRTAAENPSEPVEIQRSKYGEAMENAERERASRAMEERERELAALEEERRARERELREALEASTAEKMRAAHASDYARENYEAEEEPVEEEAVEAPEPYASFEPVAQNPGSTIAMAAPIPAAQILAEASLQDEPAVSSASVPPVVVEEPEPVQEEAGAHRRISNLPDIGSNAPQSTSTRPAEVTNPSRSGLLRRLRTSVPSLSGIINPVPESNERGSAANAVASRAARRSVANSVPSVVDVPDPSDSTAAATTPRSVDIPEVGVPAQQRSEERTGTQAAKQQPIQFDEVPRSRAGSLLSRRKAASDLSQSPQEWLNVDEDFDARTVGRERGGWESFRNDQYGDGATEREKTARAEGARRTGGDWQGGAYSRMQLGRVNTLSGVEESDAPVVVEETPEAEAARSLTGEIEQIYHFRNPLFNNEVWFVAIGADGESHNGIRAFLEEHHDELRGSMVIEVESLGAGDLSVAKEEGRIRKMSASSRVKRFTRKASAATGIALDEVSLYGVDSITSMVQQAGFQGMHVFGAENGRPALKGSPDDVMENIDEVVFDDNVNFVYELLKS